MYPSRGQPLALELLNTQFAIDGQPRDGLLTQRDLQEWMDANAAELGELRRPGPSDHLLSRFQELRGALRGLFSAVVRTQPPPADALAALNAVLAAAPRYARLDWTADGPQAHCVELAAQSDAVLLAAIARSALALLPLEHGEPRVGQCEAPGCVLFFVRDARRRHWCSAACGNRGRVARHYGRQRERAAAMGRASD